MNLRFKLKIFKISKKIQTKMQMQMKKKIEKGNMDNYRLLPADEGSFCFKSDETDFSPVDHLEDPTSGPGEKDTDDCALVCHFFFVFFCGGIGGFFTFGGFG